MSLTICVIRCVLFILPYRMLCVDMYAQYSHFHTCSAYIMYTTGGLNQAFDSSSVCAVMVPKYMDIRPDRMPSCCPMLAIAEEAIATQALNP